MNIFHLWKSLLNRQKIVQQWEKPTRINAGTFMLIIVKANIRNIQNHKINSKKKLSINLQEMRVNTFQAQSSMIKLSENTHYV